VTASLTRTDLPWIAGLAGLGAAVGLIAGISPEVAIGVSFGLAFLLLAFANLAAGLHVFVLIAFLEFVLPGGSVLSLTKLAGLVLTLSWIARIASNPGERIFFSDYPGATTILFALLAFGGLSAVWSESPAGTWLDLSRYLQVIALMIIVYSAIEDRRDARRLIAMFLLGITVTAAWALITKPTVDPTEIRITSTVGDANGVAAFLVAGLVLAGGVALGMRKAPLLRFLAIPASALFMAAFILTGSRSGVLSLGAALIAAVVFAGRWRPQAFAAVLIAAVISVGAFAAFAPDSIKERISETSPGQVSPKEGRLTIWQVGWRMFEDHPVAGVGLGSFQSSSVHYVLAPGALERTDQVIDKPEVAHNIYLQVLAEMGIVGELLFILALGFPIVCALRAAGRFARQHDRELEILSRSVAVAIVAFLVSNFFQPGVFNKLLWVLFGLGPTLLAIARSQNGDRAAV
jgi:hypothetical protein